VTDFKKMHGESLKLKIYDLVYNPIHSFIDTRKKSAIFLTRTSLFS